MILFIEFLRALAACLITNAHYTGIYPTDLIANGGLLGDVIFLPYRVIACIISEIHFGPGMGNGYGGVICQLLLLPPYLC